MRKKVFVMVLALALACTSLGAQAMLTEEEQLYYKEKRGETEAQTEAGSEAAETQTESETQIAAGSEAADSQNETQTEAETEAQTEAGSEAAEPQTEPETDGTQAETDATAAKIEGAQGAPLVALDPGHQAPEYLEEGEEPNGPGSDMLRACMTAGAEGVSTHLAEYELNLAVCLQLKEELLRRGYRVILTRETHEVSLTDIERCEIANEAGADILIHIHGNDSEDAAVTGAIATSPSYVNPYVAERYNSSMKLTDDVLDTYCEVTGLNNRGIYENDNLTSINWSEAPVTVMELGYMSNPQDDEYMADADNQKIMVKGLADGIDKYFGRQGE